MSVRSHKYSVVGVKLCASTPNFSSYIFKSFFSWQTQCMKKNEIYFLGSRRNFTKIQILSLFALMMLQTCTTFFLAFMKLFALQLNCMNSEWIKLQKSIRCSSYEFRGLWIQHKVILILHGDFSSFFECSLHILLNISFVFYSKNFIIRAWSDMRTINDEHSYACMNYSLKTSFKSIQNSPNAPPLITCASL